MKTKLLRKVRKRFEIIHYPNGKDSYHNTETVEFIDKKNSHNNDVLPIYSGGITGFMWCNSVEHGKNRFISKIIDIIKREYKQNHKPIKLWHI